MMCGGFTADLRACGDGEGAEASLGSVPATVEPERCRNGFIAAIRPRRVRPVRR